MKFTKLIILLVVFLGCSSSKSTRAVCRKFREHESYKKVVNYIIDNNLHNNFKTTKDFTSTDSLDSFLSEFIKEKRLLLIRTRSDSIIFFIDYFIPIVGKRRELRFYFTKHQELKSLKGNGWVQILLDSNICYVKY
jgi:hypothetical protein